MQVTQNQTTPKGTEKKTPFRRLAGKFKLRSEKRNLISNFIFYTSMASSIYCTIHYTIAEQRVTVEANTSNTGRYQAQQRMRMAQQDSRRLQDVLSQAKIDFQSRTEDLDVTMEALHSALDSSHAAAEFARRAALSARLAEQHKRDADHTATVYDFSRTDRSAMQHTIQTIFHEPTSEIHFSPDVAFTIFDWMKVNVSYTHGTSYRRTPAQVLSVHHADCDEQAATFAGLIETIEQRRTRIIYTLVARTRHAYPQVLVGDNSGTESFRNTLALLEDHLTRHNSVLTSEERTNLVYSGSDSETGGIWFTFDTTADTPGFRACVPRFQSCLPRMISYPGDWTRSTNSP